MTGSEKVAQDSDIDIVLSEIGGFGRFQLRNYILIAIPIALSASYVLSYIFTTHALDYR